MRARINDIPAAEDATWGAVLAALLRTNPRDFTYHWTALGSGDDGQSVIDIKTSGEDVDALRAEIEETVDLVNEVARRDPLKKMVEVDIGLVEVLVD